ncbi:MAG: hypothetical protein KDC26_07625 [Armatimonadetes bacterium]|nr:hypothetical protein [Armatimonadota bacterium]
MNDKEQSWTWIAGIIAVFGIVGIDEGIRGQTSYRSPFRLIPGSPAVHIAIGATLILIALIIGFLVYKSRRGEL